MTAVLMKVRVSSDIEVDGLGAQIAQARRADKRSVEALASAAGISRGHWYLIEKEQLKDALPIETLRRIEEVLGKTFVPHHRSEG